MEQFIQSQYGIENHGIRNVNKVYWNLPTAALYEEAIRRKEGMMSHLGPFVVRTGQHTERAPNDKFVIKEPGSEKKILWGDLNKPLGGEKFNIIYQRLLAYLQGRDIFIQDCIVGADPQYQMPIRVITEDAWHSLFTRNIFIKITDDELKNHVPDFTVICLPKFLAVPEIDGTHSDAFVIINFSEKIVLIGGTSYAGEIKQSIFTVLNYIMPQKNVLSMRCSANMGNTGDVALFFGASSTGKTTLSVDTISRTLIGDDVHGWSDNGIFNFEEGCYAKVMNLSKDDEPEIYETTRRFGTILENVSMNHRNRRLDLDDHLLTNNTRSAYPISYIARASKTGMGGHPKNIILLTCDAFGVLPPVSKLTIEQTKYHFLSGYNLKFITNEKGNPVPTVTFNACFGTSFMVLHPTVYTNFLVEKINEHNVDCWLVNTGWSGGPYGIGSRMTIPFTKSIVRAICTGKFNNAKYRTEPYFGLNIPIEAPEFSHITTVTMLRPWLNVPIEAPEFEKCYDTFPKANGLNIPIEVPKFKYEIFDPRHSWEDKRDYDKKGKRIKHSF